MKRFTETFEKIMVAVAFAEAAEFDTARQLLEDKRLVAVKPRPENRVQQRMTVK